MSMSIYTMNYNDSSIQNNQNITRPVTQTADEKNAELADIQNDMEPDLLKQKGNRGRKIEDTVEISQEGLTAYAKMQQQKGTIDTKQDSKKQIQRVSSSEMEYKAENLSEYTDSELKQMYYRGEITLQEYEDETGEII